MFAIGLGVPLRGAISAPRRQLAGTQQSRLVRVYDGAKNTATESTEAAEDIPTYFQPAQVAQEIPNQTRVAPPQPQAATETSFWAGVPPLVWIGVGVLLANVLSTALNFVKGGPQKMQEMAMQQMMKQMMKQAGGSPFGGSPGANPFAMPTGPASSAFGAGFPSPNLSTEAPGSTIDTSASPLPTSGSESKKEEAEREAVTPEVKTSDRPPSPSGSSSTKKANAFVDVDVEEKSNDSSETKTFTPPTPPPPPPPPTAESSTGSMLDMLKNPEMQKMLYPYLPEPMRNPETFEWMLNSPEYRAQLEGMLSQQMGAAAPQAVQDLMQDADMSPEKMKEQFDALGMTPEDFVQKVMSDPDLATSMTKPNVMAAIAECTKNPMAIFQYQNDEEVMRVFEKMSGLFPQAAGMGAMPGMPPNPNQ